MTDDKDTRGKELAKRLLELSRRVIDILPLGDPDGWFDWRIVRQKILTKEKAAELASPLQHLGFAAPRSLFLLTEGKALY